MSAQQLMLLALSALLLTPLWMTMHRAWRKRRSAVSLPGIPADWHRDLHQFCPLYRRVPPELQLRAVTLADTFITEKHFVGCNGLSITPTMRRVVAFQACLLIVERGLHCYAQLASVLLYPGAFIVEHDEMDPAGVISSHRQVLAGQAIDVMRVVLSWPDVLTTGRQGAACNVVIHEFAHHLDHALDGALSAPGRDRHWRALLDREYHALCQAVDAGAATLIDPYGSEDPAEFFAVVSEAFIESPRELRARHTDLYQSLSQLYGLEPAGW